MAPWAPAVDRLARNGFGSSMISVIPADGAIAPESTIRGPGKAPGIRRSDGCYVGYDWTKRHPAPSDISRWLRDGASIGMRADEFLGLDIDVLDAAVAERLEQIAVRELGPAPLRIGRAPKRLLVYGNVEKIAKRKLLFGLPGQEDDQAIEILGTGQQWVAFGVHPKTDKPYEWPRSLTTAAALTSVTGATCDAYFTAASKYLETIGATNIRRPAGSAALDRAHVDQASLRAPSVAALRECVSCIPNKDCDRDQFVKLGAAIRAAAGADIEAGAEIFGDFASRWEEGTNDPDYTRGLYDSLKPPHAVGIAWLATQARAFGFNDAALDFDAVDVALPPHRLPDAPCYSDGWWADAVAAHMRGRLLYNGDSESWFGWRGHLWVQQSLAAARQSVAEALRVLGDRLQGPEKQVGRAKHYANSEVAVRRVAPLLTGHPTLTSRQAAFDSDPFILNTPAGIVDLRTGASRPPDPNALCTRATTVAPDPDMPCPNWTRFLGEFTMGDRELEWYLQKHAGYAAAGSVREQQALLFTGKGRNGKGVFARAVQYALGKKDTMGYSHNPPSSIFADSRASQHPTEVASLVDARLAVVTEVDSRYDWNEERLKALTGGDPITARFIAQNNFTFAPWFKLWFLVNDLPGLRQVNAAMRGRLRIIPCRFEAEGREDALLDDKLRAEAPAILAWILEGSRLWLADGLLPPAAVLDATGGYFSSQDVMGAYISERCDFADRQVFTPTTDLYGDWCEYANAAGEPTSTKKHFSECLRAHRRFKATHKHMNIGNGYVGVRLRPHTVAAFEAFPPSTSAAAATEAAQ